jgi:predicted Fe-Mo cluster-binding NifX family protein
MAFVERMKELLDQGVAASKELAVKAGAKAQDLGERGVLMVEIRQLESQAQKLIGRLGTEAYQTFTERGEQVLSAESAPVKTILSEIKALRESIERKETELKLRKSGSAKQ